MTADWFCEILGNELGPLSSKQLRTLVEKGKLSPDDRVRQGTEGNWVPAGRVKGLFPSKDARGADQSQRSRPVKAVSETAGDAKGPSKRPAKQPDESSGKSSNTPKAKSAPVRVAQAAETPVAQAAAQPPSRPPLPPPVAKEPPAATPAAAAVPQPGIPAGINIVADAAGPAARATGRAAGPTGHKHKKRNKQEVVVVGLVLFVLALAGTGIALWAAMGGDGGAPQEQAAAGENEPEDIGEPKEPLDDLSIDPARPDSAGDSQATPSAAASEDQKPEESNYLDASKMPAGRGPVKVHVVSAVEGYPEFRAKVKGFEPRKCLMLTLRLENTDTSLKLDYSSWNLRQVAVRGMRLRDGKNQVYELEDFGRSIPAGPLRREVSILSDEPAEDMLIFRRPPPGVEKLFLDLPLAAFSPQSVFEGEEEMRLLIPREMITAAPETLEPEGPGPEQPVGPGTELPDDRDRPIRTGHPDLDGINDGKPPGERMVPRPEKDPFDEIAEPVPEHSPEPPGEETRPREEPEKPPPSIFDDNPELRGEEGGDAGPSFEELLRGRPDGAAPGGPRNHRERGRGGEGRGFHGDARHGAPGRDRPNAWGVEGRGVERGKGVEGRGVEARSRDGRFRNTWLPAQAVPHPGFPHSREAPNR